MSKWDDAVAEALQDAPADLTEAARYELRCLWGDLDQARRYAINGVWSMQCDGLVARIVTLSRLAGPTNWGDIQVNLLQDGTYQGILQAAGISFDPPDMAEVARVAEQIAAWNSRPPRG